VSISLTYSRLSFVISVTYRSLSPLFLTASILFSFISLTSIITDGATELIQESIFTVALSINFKIALSASIEPLYTFVKGSMRLYISTISSKELTSLDILFSLLPITERTYKTLS
jgi:hypothetical protein